MSLAELLFGRVEFQESEGYREFQYKFLLVLLVAGIVATAFFIAVGRNQSPPIPEPHMRSMMMFTAASAVLLLALRGHKARFIAVAWAYEIISLAELASALAYVPANELRILWLFTNIPGVYLVLGRTVGALATLLIVTGLVIGNPYLSAPYSSNALATAVIAMIYSAAFFHAYATRSINFFLRMRESNEKLRVMATSDALTGVLNARAYYEICDRMIRVAKRNAEPYAVLFVDLDHFKSINDGFGHAAGDHVLKLVAACLTGNLRHSDTLGRIGGEEFSVFLPATDPAGAMQVAEHLRSAIEALMPDVGGSPRKITASIGVAHNHREHPSIQAIQQQADQAMYRAKAGGRNRISAFDAIDTGSQPSPTERFAPAA